MKRIALATFVALGMGIAAGVAAQAGNDRTNHVPFADVDRDKDGKLNREEGNSINGFDFSRADTNNDGYVARAEFDAAMAHSTARGDGKVSADEANDIDGFNFSAADADDDRWLTRAEFQTAMSTSRPRG